jgi:hypothetical protein
MSERRPVDVWRDLFEVYSNAEPIDKMTHLVDPELAWETGWPGTDAVYHGHDGLRQWREAVLEPMEWDPVELLESEELDDERVRLTTRLHGRGRGSGVETEMVVHDIWTFGPAGLRHRQVFYDRAEAEAAARNRAD